MATTFKFGNKKWAVRKDNVLAYNDENNNFKPLPFDFTRDTTATYVDSDGLIKTAKAGHARIDYLDNADGHLLLEPARTNSLLQSNQFDTTWTTSNATVTSGQTGVGGSTDAWLFNSSTGYMLQFVSLSGASTMSVYAKKGTAQGIRIRIDATTEANCYIDLSNGSELFSHSGTNLDVTNVGNDWYRISLSIDSTISNVRFYAIDNTATSTSGTVYIQYAQLEAGSYATSYIPTEGSSVTRAADSTNQTPVSGIIGQTEGTLFLEFEDKDYSFSSIARGLSISDGTYTNRIYISQLTSGAIYVYSTGGAELQSTPLASGGVLKVALAYKANDYALYVNGTSVATDTSATVPACNKLYLGQEIGLTANCLNKPYREVKLYDTRLSNAELATLTT